MAKKTDKRIDPRIGSMVSDKTPYERFIVMALIELLGERKTTQMLDAIQTRDVDWTEVVAGQPMYHWNSKTKLQIAKELSGGAEIKSPDDVSDDVKEKLDAIEAALDARGLDFPENLKSDTTPAAADEESDTVDSGDGDDTAAAEDGSDTILGGDGDEDNQPPLTRSNASNPVQPAANRPVGGEDEAHFAGYPYSQLRGKSDAELLSMENIGSKTIEKIREYEADQAGQQPPPAA